MTNADDHDRLVRVEATLVEVRDALNKVVPDHESRLRSLERWKYGIPAGLVLTIFSALSAVLHQTS